MASKKKDPATPEQVLDFDRRLLLKRLAFGAGGIAYSQVASAFPGFKTAFWKNHAPAGPAPGALWQYTPPSSTPTLVMSAPTGTLTSSNSHTLIRKGDGTLWGFGNNNASQLGDGTTTSPASPIRIGSATNWSKVAAGQGFSAAVKADGTFWVWGSGSSGQFGDNGNTNSSTTPQQVGSGTTWTDVACGNSHILARQSDGSIWGWGDASYAELGDGSPGGGVQNNRLVPYKILSGVFSKLTSGQFSGYAIKSDGTLWAWGSNYSGAVGDGTTTNATVPKQVQAGTWTAVSGGNSHVTALKSNGTIWSTGRNNNGQCGDGTMTDRTTFGQIGAATDWVAIASGGFRTWALKSNGTLWGWGYSMSSTPTQIGSYSAWTAVGGGWNADNVIVLT